jgi:undecaprenyl-diphosphatase
MPLLQLALLAALAGVTEALPVSASGHAAAARLWLDAGAVRGEAFLTLGAALGLLTAARQRLGSALGEGVRAVARPGRLGASTAADDAALLFLSTAVSLPVSAITLPRVQIWAASPTATGLGLVATGLALASTALVLRVPETPMSRRGPTITGALVVGLAHGLAVFPGASRVGAALTVLLWIGVRPARAVDLAFLLSVPALLLAAARGGHGGVGTSTMALTVALAFLGAAVGSEALRGLAARRRIAALALWTLPLGLALLAYAHALPHGY